MRMKIMTLLVLALASILPVSPGLAAGRAEIVVLAGTTGLSLVRVLGQNPGLDGLDAVYDVVSDPQQAVARIISGEADLAAVPTNTAATLYNKGVPIKLAAVTNWGVMYIAGRDRSINSWSDLRGKEIAVTGRAATPEILLRYLLEANGIDPDEQVRLSYYSTPAELAQLLIAGKVQLATLPEPWVTEACLQDPNIRVLLDYQDEWKRVENASSSYPQSCLVVQDRMWDEHPQAVREFLRLAAESSGWVNASPAEAGALAEKYINITAVAAQEAIPRCNLMLAPAWEAREEIELFLKRLLAFEPQSVGGKLPDEQFYLQN